MIPTGSCGLRSSRKSPISGQLRLGQSPTWRSGSTPKKNLFGFCPDRHLLRLGRGLAASGSREEGVSESNHHTPGSDRFARLPDDNPVERRLAGNHRENGASLQDQVACRSYCRPLEFRRGPECRQSRRSVWKSCVQGSRNIPISTIGVHVPNPAASDIGPINVSLLLVGPDVPEIRVR